jgi:ribokinase
MRPRIVVIGLSGYSIFMKVGHFHQSGETISARDVFFEPGGKGYNQAVAVQRLGGEAYFISAISNDEYGRLCEARLHEEGVHPLLVRKDGIGTPLGVILTDESGENRVTVYHGASQCLTASDIEKHEDIIKSADVLLLQMEVPSEANKKALEIARRYGVMTVFNPAPPGEFSFNIVDENTVLTPNEFEARTIFGLGPEDDMNKIDELYCKHVKRMVITLGDRGCAIYDGEVKSIIPALKVEARDTTGAGDVFNAALAVGLGSGETLHKASKFAACASGLSVTKEHVLDSIPDRDTVLKTMWNHF